MKCKKTICLVIILVILIIVFSIIGYCPHTETYSKIIKKSSCYENGQMVTICKRCETVLANSNLEKFHMNMVIMN